LESFTEAKVLALPEVVAAEEELDLFGLSQKQLNHLFRTRTAIGYTGHLFNIEPKPAIAVTLSTKSKEGAVESQEIPFAYVSPGDYLPKNSLITLDDVKKFLADVEPTRVYGKSIHFSKVYPTKAGKEVKAYCFLTSRHTYNRISDDLKLPEDIRIQGGIYIAMKGMPTGIILPPPRTGRAGYWPNFYLLLEYDNITLDLGRKSITAPRVIEMLGKQAAQVFNDVDRYIKYTIREDEGTLDALISQDELQDEVSDVKKEPSVQYSDSREGSNLGPKIPFCREPRQEQDVIALFCMLLARGTLPYEMLRLSSNYRYDCFLQFSPEKAKKRVVVVAEFKLLGETILKDLEDAKARYGQLSLLICWKLDEKKLRAAGFSVDAVNQKKKELPGATHKLSFPSSAGIKDHPIAVICLSELLTTE
jgi:hypothetical protein